MMIFGFQRRSLFQYFKCAIAPCYSPPKITLALPPGDLLVARGQDRVSFTNPMAYATVMKETRFQPSA
ncbi:MAG: hypothetical protein GDA48_13775 [Hormoscilla sp. GM102CHS1]|nr:hypothetical protein [Hormoscilla sp. GM102CHS1]